MADWGLLAGEKQKPVATTGKGGQDWGNLVAGPEVSPMGVQQQQASKKQTGSLGIGEEPAIDTSNPYGFIQQNIETLKTSFSEGDKKGIDILDFGTREEHETRARGWVGDGFYDRLPEVGKGFLRAAATESVTGDYWSRRFSGESTIQEDLLMDTTLATIATGGIAVVGAPAIAATGVAVTRMSKAMRTGYLFVTRGAIGATVDAPTNIYSEVLFREGHTVAGLVVGIGGGVAGAITVERALEKTADGTLRKIAPNFWEEQVGAPDVVQEVVSTRLVELAKRADAGDKEAAEDLSEAIIKARKLAEQVKPTRPAVDVLDKVDPAPRAVPKVARTSPDRVDVQKMSRTQLLQEAEELASTLSAKGMAEADAVVHKIAVKDTEAQYATGKAKIVKEMLELEIDSDPAQQIAKRLAEFGGVTSNTLKKLGVSADQIKVLRKNFPKAFKKGADADDELTQFGNVLSLGKETGFGADIGRMFSFLAHAPDKEQFTKYINNILRDDLDEMYDDLLAINKAGLTRKLYGTQGTLAELTGVDKFTRISTKNEIAASKSAADVAEKVYRQAEKKAMRALELAQKNMSEVAKGRALKVKAKTDARLAKLKAEAVKRRAIELAIRKSRAAAKLSQKRVAAAILSKSTSNEWAEQLAKVMSGWMPKVSANVLEGTPALHINDFLKEMIPFSPLGNAVTEFMEGDAFKAFKILDKSIPVEQLTADQWKTLERFSKEFNALASRELRLLGDVKGVRLTRIMDEVTENANQNRTWLAKLENKAELNIVERGIRNIFSWDAGLKRMRFIAKDLDNMATGGVLTRTLIEPAERAGRDLITKTAKYSPQIQEVFETAASGSKGVAKHFASKVDIKIGDETLEWTRERLFMAGLNMGNTGNRAALLNTLQRDLKRAGVDLLEELEEEVLDDLWKQLSKGEIKAIKKMWGITKEMGGELSTVHRTLTGKTMDSIKDYFPISRKFDSAVQAHEARIDYMKGTRYFDTWRGAQGSSLRKLRQGGVQELDLTLGVVTKHMNDAMMQITHAVPMSNIGKVVRDPRFKDAVVSTRGKAWYEQFDSWMEGMTHTSRDVVNPTLLTLRKNTAVAMLGIPNVGVILKQPLSLISAAHDIGGGNSLRGMKYILSANAEFLNDPQKTLMAIRSISPEMAERSNSMTREMAELSKQYSPLRGKGGAALQNFQQMMMIGIRMGDDVGAGMTWLATFNRALKDTGDNVLSAKLAQEVVARTQPSGTMMELPKHLRSKNEWFRATTMFMGYFNVLHNMSTEIIRRGVSGQISKSELVSTLFTMFVLPTIVGHTITKGEPPSAVDTGKGMLSLATGGIPLARDVATTVLSGYQYSPSPLLDIPKRAIQISNQLSKGGEMDGGKLAEDASKLMGVTLGIPTASAMKRVEALLSNDSSVHDIIFGASKEK